MYTTEQHLEDLVRHIELVRHDCLLLGRRLIDRGERDFGRLLIAAGFSHDASKFKGIEWEYLHSGPDTPKAELALAIQQHVRTNSHHPEYHGGVENMPRICVAELICDLHSRSTEFGNDVREWIKANFIPKYKVDLEGQQYKWMNEFLDLLLNSSFVKM